VVRSLFGKFGAASQQSLSQNLISKRGGHSDSDWIVAIYSRAKLATNSAHSLMLWHLIYCHHQAEEQQQEEKENLAEGMPQIVNFYSYIRYHTNRNETIRYDTICANLNMEILLARQRLSVAISKDLGNELDANYLICGKNANNKLAIEELKL